MPYHVKTVYKILLVNLLLNAIGGFYSLTINEKGTNDSRAEYTSFALKG